MAHEHARAAASCICAAFMYTCLSQVGVADACAELCGHARLAGRSQALQLKRDAEGRGRGDESRSAVVRCTPCPRFASTFTTLPFVAGEAAGAAVTVMAVAATEAVDAAVAKVEA